MLTFGGVDAMLVVAAVGLVPALALVLASRRRHGSVAAVSFGLLLWSLVVIAAVTLLPMSEQPGWIPVEEAQTSCSWDIGGPAPDGFWIFGGGQRLLNTLVFVPSGLLAAVALGRWRWWATVTVPLAVVALAAYSFGIEATQLHLARLDRACDVTDMIDNASGAVLGAGAGVLLLPVLRPWRGGRARR